MRARVRMMKSASVNFIELLERGSAVCYIGKLGSLRKYCLKTLVFESVYILISYTEFLCSLPKSECTARMCGWDFYSELSRFRETI